MFGSAAPNRYTPPASSTRRWLPVIAGHAPLQHGSASTGGAAAAIAATASAHMRRGMKSVIACDSSALSITLSMIRHRSSKGLLV